MSLSREARRFIDGHQVARLATADRGGEPHLVPVCYARLGERIYFVCDEKPKRCGPTKLKRLANIAINPRVALLVDDYDSRWKQLAFLLVHADAGIVKRQEEYARAVSALRKRYPPYRSMSLGILANPMVRLQIRNWHLWRMGKSSNK